MRLTGDTNVLVRAHPRSAGPARQLLAAVRNMEHVLVLSEPILDEVTRVLRYPRLRRVTRLSEEEIERHVADLRSLSQVIKFDQGLPVPMRDPDDEAVLRTAVTGGVSVLCTLGGHFYEPPVLAFCAAHGIRVLNDVELLRLIRSPSA